MTCIIGLKHNKKIYIGGDSCTTAGYETRAQPQKKVFRIGGADILVGYCGSIRLAQIMQYVLTPPKITSPIEKYLVCDFVPALRETLSEHGWLNRENSTDRLNENARFIIGVEKQIFCIYEDFQVHSVKDNILTIGSGSEYALGAMFALSGVPPKKRILAALSIAGQLTTSVCAPYYVLSMDK